MKERSFDEMIAYFNRRVSKMDIAQDYKMELLGMVTALGYKHENTAQQWIPCSERLPERAEHVLVTVKNYDILAMSTDLFGIDDFVTYGDKVTAWMPLPEPYKEDDHGRKENIS